MSTQRQITFGHREARHAVPRTPLLVAKNISKGDEALVWSMIRNEQEDPLSTRSGRECHAMFDIPNRFGGETFGLPNLSRLRGVIASKDVMDDAVGRRRPTLFSSSSAC
jgi:hypothetical protein